LRSRDPLRAGINIQAEDLSSTALRLNVVGAINLSLFPGGFIRDPDAGGKAVGLPGSGAAGRGFHGLGGNSIAGNEITARFRVRI
jgi:hypothetical protein